MNSLLVLADEANQYVRHLEHASLEKLDIVSAATHFAARDLVASCNIILGDPPLVSKLLDDAAKLQWVQSSWAGVDSLCKPGLRRDYALTGVKDIFGAQISEYVLAYVFALERRLFELREQQSKKNWQPVRYRPSSQISMGIIGLGSIGRHLARAAGAFGIRVTGMNRSGRPCSGVESVYTSDSREAFLADLDYIVVTLPETPGTLGFIDASMLGMMKSSAVLINVGRGSVVVQDDLVEALYKGVIGGAVLDVFEEEPPSVESPLWEMSNVYITPHNAAISFPADVVEIFKSNYRRFIGGQPLMHRIDFARGY